MSSECRAWSADVCARADVAWRRERCVCLFGVTQTDNATRGLFADATQVLPGLLTLLCLLQGWNELVERSVQEEGHNNGKRGDPGHSSCQRAA